MARPKAADYDAQRDRILDRAVQAFARIGFPSASMSELADACGTSKAALYHYYPSKQAMLYDALDRYTTGLAAQVAQIRARGLAPRDELAETVRALMHTYAGSHSYHAALLHDVKFLDAPQAATIRAQERAVVDAIADTIARAYPQRYPDARKPMTMALLGMINFTFAWLRPDGPMSHAQFAELAIDLWTRGLQGGTPAARCPTDTLES